MLHWADSPRREPQVPEEVREACQLVLGAWLVDMAGVMVLAYHLPVEGDGTHLFAVLLFGTGSLVIALPRFWLLRKIWRGRRWARSALLVLLGLGWFLLARGMWSSFANLDPLALTAGVAGAILEVIALPMLFGRRASIWFAQQQTTLLTKAKRRAVS